MRYVVNGRLPHPLKNGKGVLVDYALSSLMLPTLVIGASTAVLVNRMLPDVIIISLYAAVLTVMIYINFKKVLNVIEVEAKAAIEKEKKQAQERITA